jgi:hypothetical protein
MMRAFTSRIGSKATKGWMRALARPMRPRVEALDERRGRLVLRPGVVVDEQRREEIDLLVDRRHRGGDAGALVRHEEEQLDHAIDRLAVEAQQRHGAELFRRLVEELLVAGVLRGEHHGRYEPVRLGRALEEGKLLGRGRRDAIDALLVQEADDGAHDQLGHRGEHARDLDEPGNEVGDEARDGQVGAVEHVTVDVDDGRRRRGGARASLEEGGRGGAQRGAQKLAAARAREVSAPAGHPG